jgi:hypothetical protein
LRLVRRGFGGGRSFGGGGLFGGGRSRGGGGGLFGSSKKSGGGWFGSSKSKSTTSKSASKGWFGSKSKPSTKSKTSGGLFGAKPKTGPGSGTRKATPKSTSKTTGKGKGNTKGTGATTGPQPGPGPTTHHHYHSSPYGFYSPMGMAYGYSMFGTPYSFGGGGFWTFYLLSRWRCIAVNSGGYRCNASSGMFSNYCSFHRDGKWKEEIVEGEMKKKAEEE